MDDPSWAWLVPGRGESWGAEAWCRRPRSDGDLQEALLARAGEPAERLQALDRKQLRVGLDGWLAGVKRTSSRQRSYEACHGLDICNETPLIRQNEPGQVARA